MKAHVLSLALAAFVSAALPTAHAAPPDPKQTPEPKQTPVQVMNTTSNPVPVYGLVEVAEMKTPFMQQIQCTAPVTQHSCAATYAVPAGKRLVLEYVGAVCSNTDNPHGVYPTPFAMTIIVSGVQFGLNLPATGPVFNFNQWYSFGHAVRLYAAPETAIEFGFFITNDTPVGCSVGLSGYTVAVQ